MRCKQCAADNDERAIECGWCGAGMRRPYPYDALGQWLEQIDRDLPKSRPLLGYAVVIALVGLFASPFVLKWGGFVDGWLASFAFMLGGLSVGIGAFALLDGYSVRRGRARFRDVVHPILAELYRETDMQRWRAAVIIQESLPRRSHINAHFLAGELPDDDAA